MSASTKWAILASLAGALAVCGGVGAIAFAVACSSVELLGPPDAQLDPSYEVIETRDCPTSPVPLCDAMPAGAGGCIGEPWAPDSAASAIPTDASYPVGCTVNIPSSYRTPQHECLVAYACRCTSPGAASADSGSQWACAR